MPVESQLLASTRIVCDDNGPPEYAMKGSSSSIPSAYSFKYGGDGSTIRLDADLDNIHISVDKVPDPLPTLKLESSVKELPVFRGEILSIPKIELAAETSSEINVAIKEIPEVRAHAPAHYELCFSLFGVKLWSFSVCGESQLITEKYVPRSAEHCE